MEINHGMGDFQNHGVSKQLFDSSGDVKDIRSTPFKKAQGSMETDTVLSRTLHDGRWQLMIPEFDIEQLMQLNTRSVQVAKQ
jgi:hypothetical protein